MVLLYSLSAFSFISLQVYLASLSIYLSTFTSTYLGSDLPNILSACPSVLPAIGVYKPASSLFPSQRLFLRASFPNSKPQPASAFSCIVPTSITAFPSDSSPSFPASCQTRFRTASPASPASPACRPFRPPKLHERKAYNPAYPIAHCRCTCQVSQSVQNGIGQEAKTACIKTAQLTDIYTVTSPTLWGCLVLSFVWPESSRNALYTKELEPALTVNQHRPASSFRSFESPSSDYLPTDATKGP